MGKDAASFCQNAKGKGSLYTTHVQVRHLNGHIQQYNFKMLHYNSTVE